jgi:hypothetical protein
LTFNLTPFSLKAAAAEIEDPFGALSATYARIAHADFSEVSHGRLSH